MIIRCHALDERGHLPPSCARTGVAGARNASPHLEWSDTPPGTHSLVLTIVDLHPIANGWVHWLVVDIPAGTAGLAGGASGQSMPSGASELRNTFGTAGYGGPQPPPGSGPHEYRMTVYALDVPGLPLPPDAALRHVERAMKGHILGEASVSGWFER